MDTHECNMNEANHSQHQQQTVQNRRKSRFDLPPPTDHNNILVNSCVNSNQLQEEMSVNAVPDYFLHDLNENKDTFDQMNYEEDIIKSSLARLKPIISLSNNDNSISVPQSYISVTDPEFTRRLERALQKNFEYIRRKDEILAAMLLSGGSLNSFSSETLKLPTQRKFSRLMPNKRVIQDRAGIGVSAQVDGDSKGYSSKAPATSVYVSNLPKDISEDELHILFGPVGKIKKIKLYKDSCGQQKGDALVSFAFPESVSIACSKLNKLDIGEGFKISVVQAEFGSKDLSAETASHPVHIDDRDLKSAMRDLLPVELETDKYAFVIFANAFKSTDHNAVDQLEMEIMIECCQFGTVKVAQSILSPMGTDVNKRDNYDGLLSIFGLEGCVVVSFDSTEAARNCASALQDKSFNNRELKLSWSEALDHDQQRENASCEIVEESIVSESILIEMDREEENVNVDDVEDFLNSLL